MAEKSMVENSLYRMQCDQIWQFFGLWATFSSLWQQLICPNLPTFLGNFCKGVKIYHFHSEIIFRQLLKTFGNFYLVTLTVWVFFPPFLSQSQVEQAGTSLYNQSTAYSVFPEVNLGHSTAVVAELHHELVALDLELVEMRIHDGVLAREEESAACKKDPHLRNNLSNTKCHNHGLGVM